MAEQPQEQDEGLTAQEQPGTELAELAASERRVAERGISGVRWVNPV